MNNIIKLTKAEIQSGHTRQLWAEGLIEQLPANHDGRNSWLLNYGVRGEAQQLRSKRGVLFDHESMAAETAPLRPLRVGDRVQTKRGATLNFSKTAEIKAIDGMDAWLGWGDKSHSTYRLSDLERVP